MGLLLTILAWTIVIIVGVPLIVWCMLLVLYGVHEYPEFAAIGLLFVALFFLAFS